MVTMQEYSQKLAERAAILDTAKKQAQSFDPASNRTQRQLRSASLTEQQKIKSLSSERKRVLETIKKEEAVQAKLERDFQPVREKFQKQLKYQEDWNKVSQLISSGNPFASLALENKQQERLFRAMKAGQKVKPTVTEEQLSMSLPAELRYSNPQEVVYGMSMPRMSIASPSDLQSMEQKGLQLDLSEFELKDVPQTKVTAGGRTQEYVQKYDPFVLSPAKVVDVATTGVGTAVTRLAEKAGVPTIKEDIKIPERRFLEKGTGVLDQDTGEFKVPDNIFIEGAPTTQETIARQTLPSSRQTTKISPETLGGVAKGVATVGAYTYPPIGVPLLTSEVYKGAKLYKETGDKSILGPTILAAGFLAVPGAAAGLRYAKKPVIIPLGPKPVPKPTKYLSKVNIPDEGIIKVSGFKVGIKETPGIEFSIQPKWQTLLKIKPKIYKTPPKIEAGVTMFAGPPKDLASLGFAQKFGRSTKPRDPFVARTKTREIDISDLSDLGTFGRSVTRELPPRFLTPDVKTSLGAGARVRLTQKGKLVKDYPITFARTKPVHLAEKGISIYAGEGASVSLKSLRPRKPPKVDLEEGLIFIERIPQDKTGVKYLSGKKRKISLQEQKQVADVISTIPVQLKPLSPPKISKASIAPESYIYYPTYVGGLGRGSSYYYARGKAEEVSVAGPLVLKPDQKPVKVEAISRPTETDIDYLKTKADERIKFVTLGAEREKKVTKEGMFKVGAEKEKEVLVLPPKEIEGTKITQIPRPIQKEKTKIKTKLVSKQEKAVRPKPITPTRPPGDPRPKPPKPKIAAAKPPKDYLPDKYKPKKKKKLELFIPFVKRYGKYQPVSKAVSREKAFKIGKKRLRKTLAASLQIRRRGGDPIPFAKPGKEFRRGKSGKDPLTLVQRAPRRLSARGEVREIILSRRNNFLK